MAIDHAFIERKRAIIAQIERDAAHLPNPFLGLPTRKPAFALRTTKDQRAAILAASVDKPTRKSAARAARAAAKGGKR